MITRTLVFGVNKMFAKRLLLVYQQELVFGYRLAKALDILGGRQREKTAYRS